MACINVLVFGAAFLLASAVALQPAELQTCQALIRQHGLASENPANDRVIFISERPGNADICTDECIGSVPDDDDEDGEDSALPPSTITRCCERTTTVRTFQGFLLVFCPPPATPTTAQPATTSPPTTAQPATTSPPNLPRCSRISGLSRNKDRFTRGSCVSEVRCLRGRSLGGNGFDFRPVTRYRCCDGYEQRRVLGSTYRLRCQKPSPSTQPPPPTTTEPTTTAPTQATSPPSGLPRCPSGSSSRLSTFCRSGMDCENVCKIRCIAGSSFTGISFGRKEVDRYHCCNGTRSVEVFRGGLLVKECR